MMALCCDIRIMTGGRGLLSLNENVIGIPLAPSGTELVKMKLAPNFFTPVALGDRFNQKQALAAGILHEIVEISRGPNGLLERAIEIGVSEGPKASWGVWGAIKQSMYRTVIDACALPRQPRSVELDQLFWARIARQDRELAVKSKL
jgi:enoyl-CoA hydratase/carnithine racemase